MTWLTKEKLRVYKIWCVRQAGSISFSFSFRYYSSLLRGGNGQCICLVRGKTVGGMTPIQNMGKQKEPPLLFFFLRGVVLFDFLAAHATYFECVKCTILWHWNKGGMYDSYFCANIAIKRNMYVHTCRAVQRGTTSTSICYIGIRGELNKWTRGHAWRNNYWLHIRV